MPEVTPPAVPSVALVNMALRLARADREERAELDHGHFGRRPDLDGECSRCRFAFGPFPNVRPYGVGKTWAYIIGPSKKDRDWPYRTNRGETVHYCPFHGTEVEPVAAP